MHTCVCMCHIYVHTYIYMASHTDQHSQDTQRPHMNTKITNNLILILSLAEHRGGPLVGVCPSGSWSWTLCLRTSCLWIPVSQLLALGHTSPRGCSPSPNVHTYTGTCAQAYASTEAQTYTYTHTYIRSWPGVSWSPSCHFPVVLPLDVYTHKNTSGSCP